MNKYSETIVNEMREIGSFTYDSAKAFGEKHGLTFRSVIAKVRALELDYAAKDPKVKTASKPKARAKADIVTSIERVIRVNLPSLSKMTIADLEVLESELQRVNA